MIFDEFLQPSKEQIWYDKANSLKNISNCYTGNKKNLLNWANMQNKLVTTLCGIDIYKVEELEQNCALFLLSEDRNEENIQYVIKVEF